MENVYKLEQLQDSNAITSYLKKQLTMPPQIADPSAVRVHLPTVTINRIPSHRLIVLQLDRGVADVRVIGLAALIQRR